MDISTAAATPFFDSYGASASFLMSSREAGGPGRDSVNVSSNCRLITEALKSAHSSPDMRQDKIAAIRERIANGTYEIDARRIARCLIREEPGLFQL